MRKQRDKVTVERLREVLNYDPASGIFTWRISTCTRPLAGRVAGRIVAKGYISIGIDSVHYFAHRLAWLYVHGEWPNGLIDHINGKEADNRIANLRVVDDRTNKENQHKASIHNKSTGLLGVSFHKAGGKYTAQIHHNRRKIHLGSFNDPNTAHMAYLEAKRRIHAGCTI